MSGDVDPIEAELAELDAEEGKTSSSTVRRFLPATLAIVTLVSFGTVVWYAYSTGVREGSEFAAPILKPDGPSKVAPKSPGGQRIADQDKLVYGKIDKSGGGRKVERLLPPPENPLPAPIARKPEAVAKPPLPTPKLGVPKAPPTSDLPPPPSITAPRKATTSTKEKNDKQSRDESAVASVAPSAGSNKGPRAAGSVPDATSKKRETPVKPVKKSTTPPAPPKKAAAKTLPTKNVPKAPPTPSKVAKLDPLKGFRIQIGSLRSDAAARRAWKQRVKQHETILSRLTLFVKRADLGKKGVYYRVQAGPLSNKAAAQRICDELKQKKVGCFVVRP